MEQLSMTWTPTVDQASRLMLKPTKSTVNIDPVTKVTSKVKTDIPGIPCILSVLLQNSGYVMWFHSSHPLES